MFILYSAILLNSYLFKFVDSLVFSTQTIILSTNINVFLPLYAIHIAHSLSPNYASYNIKYNAE